MHTWTFVDDTVARAEGKLEHVRSTILGVADTLKAGLDEQHLQVSGKTVVIASHPQLAKDLHRALLRRGVPCEAANRAVDLGVDTTTGRSEAAAQGSEPEEGRAGPVPPHLQNEASREAL